MAHTKRIIISVLSAVVLLSCERHREVVEPELESNNEITALNRSATSSCSCPDSVELVGNSPNGNKIIIKGVDENTGSISIAGDDGTLAGNSGVWISDDTYTSTELTLTLTCDDGSIQECSYDENGELTEDNGCQDVVVEDFTLTNDGYGTVTATWTSVKEQNLELYKLLRDGVEVADNPPEGEGSPYQIDDSPGQSGTYVYVLVASLSDGSECEVAMSSITL